MCSAVKSSISGHKSSSLNFHKYIISVEKKFTTELFSNWLSPRLGKNSLLNCPVHGRGQKVHRQIVGLSCHWMSPCLGRNSLLNLSCAHLYMAEGINFLYPLKQSLLKILFFVLTKLISCVHILIYLLNYPKIKLRMVCFWCPLLLRMNIYLFFFLLENRYI